MASSSHAALVDAHDALLPRHHFTLLTPVGVSGITYSAEWSTTLPPAGWPPIPDTGIAPQHLFSVPVGGNTGMFMRFVITNP